MNYVAFTDEAGSWSDENSGVYVRSFVLFEEDAYLRLAGLMGHKWPHLALKWTKDGKNFAQNNAEVVAQMFEGARIFTVFTDVAQFYGKVYRIRGAISGLDYDEILKDFKKPFGLQGDLMNKVNQLLFLNVYERQFFERFLAAAAASIENFELSALYIDNPQQNNRDFETMLRDVVGESVEFDFVKDDSRYFGLGLADFVASSFRDILCDTTRRGAKEFYVTYVAPHNLPGSTENPNPSYQFWPDGDATYKERMVEVWKATRGE